MAVFTELSFDEVAALVARLRIGELTALQGIASGIENTNYFADTTGGRYVLTVFERLGFAELPFYLGLMQHLARRGIPVPEPQADAAGSILHSLRGKPAAVVARLPGAHHLAPDAADCASVGTLLARMHLAGADFALSQPNLRGLAWWRETVPVVAPFLDADARTLITAELAWQEQLAASPAHAALPRGAIHADLFRDNVMFDAGRLSGFFDFYFAGVDCSRVRHRGVPERLVHRPGQRRPRRRTCQRLRGWLRRGAHAAGRRTAAAAGDAARRGAALLDVAPVGRAPAARRQPADAA